MVPVDVVNQPIASAQQPQDCLTRVFCGRGKVLAMMKLHTNLADPDLVSQKRVKNRELSPFDVYFQQVNSIPPQVPHQRCRGSRRNLKTVCGVPWKGAERALHRIRWRPNQNLPVLPFKSYRMEKNMPLCSLAFALPCRFTCG